MLTKFRFIQIHSSSVRSFSSQKIKAPPMVYISGEEMTRYAGELYLNHWIRPYIDISKWEFFDLSAINRDRTDDQVLKDAIAAGKRIGSIYKEPTVTPTEEQKISLGLKKAWGSPNGAMRSGWNGITISRDTINIPGMELGYKNPVLFDRHAVGGEYHATFKIVGAGRSQTIFYPKDGTSSVVVDDRLLTDACNAVVTYHNPYDNVTAMSHHFFSRCLEAKVTPYVVTKKTVFKWQEELWKRMKKVFDENYKSQFAQAGLLKNCGGELQHYLSDVASMNLIRWSNGGFGMCAHNYDGDVLTDEIAQIHRSPGFLTSVLNGLNDDGTIIKEFEASHGTVTDLWNAHQKGEETSLNPLSMMEALIGAIQHSVLLSGGPSELSHFATKLRSSIHTQMTVPGKATRDLSGPTGLTTEQFVQAVKERIDKFVSEYKPSEKIVPVDSNWGHLSVDTEMIKTMFTNLDEDKDGSITLDEFIHALRKLGITPRKLQE